MLPSLFGLKGLAIAVGVALLAGGTIGARVQKKLDNAAYYKEVAAAKDMRIAALEGQIKTRDAAAKLDTERAVADALERKKLEESGRELENKSSDRVCFDDAATQRLRDLWPEPARRPAASRPAAGPR